ncbi:AMP-binding protein [Conchiformibius kuhniae]|uniref:AMP-binding protein n=1 Tax=Conchiformibius kuhniae TaxID=211502 RepID=A0A8T9MRW2_9NEIS|nr:AMP-binding protein [Conchiformibius kuhniae]
MMTLETVLRRPPQGDIAEHWTYADFAAATQAWAHRLRARKVRSAALWFDDTARCASALAATWLAGADVYLLPDVSPASRQWAAQQGCIVFGDTDAADEGWRYRDADERARSDLPDLGFPSDNRLFLKTSASSGDAKTVCKTRAQMESEAAALARLLPAHWRGATALGSVGTQHLYGLTFRIFAALACGWRIGRVRHPYPEDLFAASRHAPCVWVSSPALLHRAGGRRDWQSLRRHLRGVVSAGGMLRPDVAAQLAARLGFYPHDVYGSTETGVIAVRRQSGMHLLLPEVSAEIAADGTLSADSPWSGGRQHTADAAERHGRALLLHGRADRIVKLADKRIALTRIEQLLSAHPFVADAHCLPHPQHGRIAAWLALNDDGIAAWRNHGRRAMIDTLQRTLGELKPLGAVPRHWRFTDRLPRNPQAKIRAADAERAFTRPITAPQWHALPADTPDESVFTAAVPLDLCWFGGHFARFPLVPGVVQLQWVLDLCCRGHVPAQIENLKYQKFIRPHDTVRLYLRRDHAKNKLYFSLRLADGSVCSSGRFALPDA